jgi:hypothetical protein
MHAPSDGMYEFAAHAKKSQYFRNACAQKEVVVVVAG